jgi:hypothetical protein
MLERLLDIEASEHETLTEETELICTMTGFRRRYLGSVPSLNAEGEVIG